MFDELRRLSCRYEKKSQWLRIYKRACSDLPNPQTSLSDEKAYRVIRLSNGLKVTVISDESEFVEYDEFDIGETDSESSEVGSGLTQSDGIDANINKIPPFVEKLAACSLSVAAGCFSDPEDIPGLAHFVGHTVFKGSSVYPRDNEFHSFITRNGGSDNSSTDCEVTTFCFECSEQKLKKALDRFSQLFINPSITDSAIASERRLIDSEFHLSLTSDTLRKHQLICSTAHESNPAGKFACGNFETLMDDVTDTYLFESVKNFRDTHYLPHRMALAVQARIPEKVLRRWVARYFCEIENYSETPPEFEVKALFTEDFKKLFFVESLSDACCLDLNWILPPVIYLYKVKPLKYLSFVIGGEGKGSLLSYLKKKFWAFSIRAGNSDEGLMSNSLYSVFSISISLSSLGTKHIRGVLHAVFSYLRMLKNEGPCERLFAEMQAIAEMNFDRMVDPSAMEHVENISENMLLYPAKYYITGGELFFQFDPEEIMSFLKLMTPGKVNIMISWNGMAEYVELDRVEPCFKINYKMCDIPQTWISDWKKVTADDHFYLPYPNEFITSDFTLMDSCIVTKYPEKIGTSELIDIWYKRDNKFFKPVAFIGIHFITNHCKRSSIGCVYSMIYIKTLEELLSEELNQATSALLHYSFDSNEYGISLTVYGFNQKLHLVLAKIAAKMCYFNEFNNNKLFSQVKSDLLESWYNKNLNPKNVARDLRMSIIVNGYYSGALKYRTLKIATYNELKIFARDLFKEVHVQCLVQGNISKVEAIIICEEFINTLDCGILVLENYPRYNALELPKGQNNIKIYSFNKCDKNCTTTKYYQFCPGRFKESVALQLFILLMEEPLFRNLRSSEQLGYDVSCIFRDTYGIIGFTLTVHSEVDEFSLEHIDDRMLNFLEEFFDYIKTLPQNEFHDAKVTLCKVKNLVDVDLNEEAQRNWSEIKRMDYIFDRCKKELAVIRNLHMKKLTRLIRKYLYDKKMLMIQVVGHDDDYVEEPLSPKPLDEFEYKLVKCSSDSLLTTYITNIDEFKRTLQPYPYWKMVK